MINKSHNPWMDYILERRHLPMEALERLRGTITTQPL